MNDESTLVEAISAASRVLVRELGCLHARPAGSEHSPAAVHALLELAARGTMTASQLAQVLGLSKPGARRLVCRLVSKGEMEESVSAGNARGKHFSLTARGRETLAHIDVHGRRLVTSALEHLPPSQRLTVAQGLGAYAEALQACRGAAGEGSRPAITISSGYRPGLIGRVAEMHALYYSRHSGFGQFFESQVASGMAELAARLDEACNGVWVALQCDRIVGSIIIDGQDLGNNNAHLRWFIVDEGCRGLGIGRQLLSEAMRFCDRCGFAATQLWTFKGLNAARHLYESFGFELVQEKLGEQWGRTVSEQHLIRPGARAAGHTPGAAASPGS